ncbi:MAG: hypothetical protein K1X88_31875 [Nannocystaceae bacterium]|nr:hypothetical protein [Nannocystaceae bacterium]
MSLGADRQKDIELVRRAVLDHLKVHPRVADQGHAPDAEMLQALADTLPQLSAFGTKSFAAVRAILDWDHQLPSQFYLLRVLASYDDRDRERVEAVVEDRDEEIGETNLYPEFDLPDYGEIDASESYVAVLRAGTARVEDFRFLSHWRKQVGGTIADLAIKTVTRHPNYQKAAASRRTDGLGGAVVIGWAPPCLANTENWAVEIWLLTEFDGHTGKARVFMVDPERKEVTREYETDVQLA